MQPDLTVRDICKLMEVHPDTVRRLARQDRLPGAYKVGRQWRFAREAIDELRGRIVRSTYERGIELSDLDVE
ncbi:MAG: helix-turn-helix domain-containing protein, partial [Planctomycetes bacterium]|nr:helix-turn-helix domain-containing protein [Planctomycetota bacterium]